MTRTPDARDVLERMMTEIRTYDGDFRPTWRGIYAMLETVAATLPEPGAAGEISEEVRNSIARMTPWQAFNFGIGYGAAERQRASQEG